MSSKSPCALRVLSSREALPSYDLPPGGATPNPRPDSLLAGFLGAPAIAGAALPPAPSGWWIVSVYVVAVALGFVAGWWLGRIRLGYEQSRPLTDARYKVRHCRELAREVQRQHTPETAGHLPWREFTADNYNSLGEIARECDAAQGLLGSAQWPRPLGVPVNLAPAKVFPFAPANRKAR